MLVPLLSGVTALVGMLAAIGGAMLDDPERSRPLPTIAYIEKDRQLVAREPDCGNDPVLANLT